MKPDTSFTTHVFNLTEDHHIEIHHGKVWFNFPDDIMPDGQGVTDLTNTNLGKILLEAVKASQ